MKARKHQVEARKRQVEARKRQVEAVLDALSQAGIGNGRLRITFDDGEVFEAHFSEEDAHEIL